MGIPILDAAIKIIDKIIPDPAAKAEAKLKVLELQQNGELKALELETQLALGQLEVNKVEAGSDSLFKSGWRPAVGWVCVAGLATQFLLAPLLPWLVGLIDSSVAPIPSLDLSELLTLLFGMLGLGAMRTTEKLKGKA